MNEVPTRSRSSHLPRRTKLSAKMAASKEEKRVDDEEGADGLFDY